MGGNASTTNYTVKQNSANSFTVAGLSSSKGKITDSAEGIAAAFYQVEANRDFTITATVTLDKYAATSQSGFGIMLRDDIYIDQNVKSIKSNYVAAGSYLLSGTVNTLYSRSSGSKITNTDNHATLAQGDSIDVSIQRTGSAITVTFGEFTYTYNGFNLTAIDADYDYICLYATRNTTVTFTNVTVS